MRRGEGETEHVLVGMRPAGGLLLGAGHRLDGLDVMVSLVGLANAVIWTVRAAEAFRGRNAPEGEGRD